MLSNCQTQNFSSATVCLAEGGRTLHTHLSLFCGVQLHQPIGGHLWFVVFPVIKNLPVNKKGVVILWLLQWASLSQEFNGTTKSLFESKHEVFNQHAAKYCYFVSDEF